MWRDSNCPAVQLTLRLHVPAEVVQDGLTVGRVFSGIARVTASSGGHRGPPAAYACSPLIDR